MTTVGIPLTSKRTVAFTPPSLREEHPEVSFEIRVPNYQDRDEIGLRLYRMGMRQISTDTIRALMVSELYTLEDAPTPDIAETKAEEKAIFLENHWQQRALEDAEFEAWEIQERERKADEAAGGEPREPAPKPARLTSVRDRARVTLMTQDVVDGSQRVRDMLAEQQGYDIRYRLAMIRLHLAHIHGLKTKVSMSGGLVDEACIEALREELAGMAPTAYEELIQEISDLYELPKAEVGNSGSPPANTSPGNGSDSPSGDSAASVGSSTSGTTGPQSSIEPAPVAASPITTAPLCEPSSAAADNTAPSDGPTTVA